MAITPKTQLPGNTILAALKISKAIVIAFVLSFSAVCSSQDESGALDLTAINELPIKNLTNPEQATFSSGQPTQEEIKALAQAGIKHVINLRPAQEQEQQQDWNEGELVQSLGMQYHSVSVAGAAGVTIDNATTLAGILEEIDGEPVLLHCGSGNRVGALIALREGALNEASIDESVATGKLWGLTGLEPVVRERLATPGK